MVEELTKEDLKEIQERCDKATFVPHAIIPEKSTAADGWSGLALINDLILYRDRTPCLSVDNAKFIAFARTDIPKLIENLKAEKAENKRLVKAWQKFADAVGIEPDKKAFQCDVINKAKKLKTIAENADKLSKQIDVVCNSPEWSAVWFCFQNHGGDYSKGPSFKSEHDELKLELGKKV